MARQNTTCNSAAASGASLSVSLLRGADTVARAGLGMFRALHAATVAFSMLDMPAGSECGFLFGLCGITLGGARGRNLDIVGAWQ